MSNKDKIKTFLEQKEFHKLVELARNERGTVRHITSFLYNEDNLLHWRAVEGLGRLAEHPDILSIEKIRVIISRLFLNLEDRSGGNAWGTIEAIGAMIAARLDQLDNQIPKMLIYMKDAKCWVGLLWAMRKIGEKRPDLLEGTVPYVIGLLRNPRRTTRGHAVWVLGAIGYVGAQDVLDGRLSIDIKETLEGLLHDKNPVIIYDNGDLRERIIGDLAQEALAALGGRQGGTRKATDYFDYVI